MNSELKTVRFDRIPAVLKRYRHWVCYKCEPCDEPGGKPKKIPYNPKTGKRAKINDISTFGSYQMAVKAFSDGQYEGIGFVFTKEDPFVGIDLDDCRDPETGKLNDFARNIVKTVDSYTEISPSGTGLHIIVQGQLPGSRTRAQGIEMYQQSRYFTVTGRAIRGGSKDVEKRQKSLDRLYYKTFSQDRDDDTESVLKATEGNPVKTDYEVISLASQAKNGKKFETLMKGDTSSYNSHSEADLALCQMLVFHVGDDQHQIDRIFRKSGLFREKWDKRHSSDGQTYGQKTIEKAIKTNKTRHAIPSQAKEEASNDVDDRPRIILSNRPPEQISDDIVKVLQKTNNPPELFLRQGRVVRVCPEGQIEPIKTDILRGILTRKALVGYHAPRGDQFINKPLPETTLRDVLLMGTWNLPELLDVVTAPTIRPKGSILTKPGYDRKTRVYHVPKRSLQMPKIPEEPTRNDAQNSAKYVLDEFLCDFPFTDDASKANTLAFFLSPVIRPCVTGFVPLAVITAPDRGSGKTLLPRLSSLIAAGDEPSIIAPLRSEDEWRKRITSVLMKNPKVVVIDNLEKTLNCNSLAVLLTSPVWEDRLLSANEIVRVPNRAILAVTGNNVRVSSDFHRRIYPITLDAKMAQPWTRSHFVISDIIGWANKHRGELLAALLTTECVNNFETLGFRN